VDPGDAHGAPIAFTIPFFLAFRWLGLQDTIIGLAIVYLTFNLAVVIWLMQTFFAAIPVTLEEAAWMDGCSLWGSFWRVSLPLVKPASRRLPFSVSSSRGTTFSTP
jgi:multiple sugar transport system permease protein